MARRRAASLAAVVLILLAGACSSGGSATTAAPPPSGAADPVPDDGGVPPPHPFGVEQLVALGDWQLFVSTPTITGSDVTVPVRMVSRATRAVTLSPADVFTLQDGIAASQSLDPVAVEGLAGRVRSGESIEGVLRFRVPAPLETPMLFFHGDVAGAQSALVQLAGTPPEP